MFFVDLYNPNSNELGTSLELGILRWNQASEDRPSVFVHTFIEPDHYARVKWTLAKEEMHISQDFLQQGPRLPTIKELIQKNYLDKKTLVCFDKEFEPIKRLVHSAREVISVKELWQEYFAKDERALRCGSINKMCEYINLEEDNPRNHNYTPLLKRLYKLTALWCFLSQALASSRYRSASQIIANSKSKNIWPLPDSKQLEVDESIELDTLKDIPVKALEDFFSGNLDDIVEWSHCNKYYSDWNFYSKRHPDIVEHLEGKDRMAEFIFNQVLTLDQQLWVLISYALFRSKQKDVLEIIRCHGIFSKMKRNVREFFTNFIISNLRYFLSEQMQLELIEALIGQSMMTNDEKPFESYDYDMLVRQRGHLDSKYYFTDNGPKIGAESCIKEIRNIQGTIIYRRFEIRGYGEARRDCIESVNYAVDKLFKEAQDPFSGEWLTKSLKLWIQFITDFNFSELSRAPKQNDTQELINMRNIIKQMIFRQGQPYINKLVSDLKKASQLIEQTDNLPQSFGFNFQGVSIEFIVQRESRGNVFKRIFSFN